MKKAYTILLLWHFIAVNVQAQIAKSAPVFLPSSQPVAIKEGDSTYMLVGDYWLLKSLSARIGGRLKLSAVKRQVLPNGGQVLVFDARPWQANGSKTLIIVPLLLNAENGQYFVGNSATTCSGCEGCKLVNGQCSCESSGADACLIRSDQSIAFPLSEIKMSLERD